MKQKNPTWRRIWTELQCAVITLLTDTPWRMFLQVITLCGWPHNQHSVIYPSYKSTNRNPVSRICLWFNWPKLSWWFSSHDCFIVFVKHQAWNAGERRQTVHLDFNATTSAHSRRLNKHIFIFSPFRQQQRLIVVWLNCHKTVQARRTILSYTPMCVF